MKPITTAISKYLLPCLIWFTIFFDPAGEALGSSIIILPDFLLTIATISGNLLWLVGVILLGVTGLFMWMLYDESSHNQAIEECFKYEKDIKNATAYTIGDKHGNPLFHEETAERKAFRWFTVSGAIIAIGSGFWFTGTTWLLATITGIYYNAIGIELAESIIKEKQKEIIDEKYFNQSINEMP